ncbi:MAG: hypothetical protein ACI81I_000073 [Arcobacteraceae bacterium]|jgi:hypothetical protein
MENNSTIALTQTETINNITDQSLEKISQSNLDAIDKITQLTNNAIDKITQSITEAINTLTPATNEAIAQAVKVAVDKISLASIETVSRLSQTPTQSWYESATFWTGFTGLATLGAVLAALGVPFYEKRHKIKVCINFIEEELKSNYKVIVLMKRRKIGTK